MFPQVVFIDINDTLISQISELFQKNQTITIDEQTIKISDHINYKCIVDDITNHVDESNTAFTSAANSEGMLLGGVDNALSKMFPLVQENINEIIIDNGYVNKYREHFIPVGSSTLVPICETDENQNNQYLITAPTMLTPSRVDDTDNCYHALYAVLRVVQKFNDYLIQNKQSEIKTIYVPGMGTGVGGISPENASQQFLDAITDFVSIDLAKVKKLNESQQHMFEDISEEPNVFIKCPSQMIKKQPEWYTYVSYRKKKISSENVQS